MIRKLKARIKKHGINKVTCDLGYRSTNTIYTWIKNGEVPEIAKQKVKDYLNS